MNVGELVESRAEANPDMDFLHFLSEKVTSGELDRKSNSVANGLTFLGVKKGDKVALLLPNCPEFLYAWFGLAKLGAVMVPLNVHLKGEGLLHIINHSDAETIILDSQYLDNFVQIESSAHKIRTRVYHGLPCGEIPPGATAFSDVMKSECTPPKTASRVEAEDIMSIVYTSGTTGLPKGVVLSHHGYLSAAEEITRRLLRVCSEDVYYTSMPLFHVNAQQVTTLGALLSGARMVLSNRFRPSAFWEEISASGATIFVSVGAMIHALCKQAPGEYDQSHRVRLVPSAAVPRQMWQEFEQRFNTKILECYGLTEAGTVCLANPPEAIRVGSIGKPVSHAEVKVFDENDNEQPPGVPGEIAARAKTPHIFMEGYYKMPQETEQALRGGWFHTGDRGYVDGDGYFFFIDRIKDCIRRKGENVSSLEIEKAVNSHPKVLESAAIGVPSEHGEEDVKICVVLRPGETLSPSEIIAHCAERIAYFMVPRYVEFRETLPKTLTERVQKFELRRESVGEVWDREKEGYRFKR